MPAALRFMFKDEEGEKGEVSSFGALCTSLSATIGTGNIVGVATAIGILAGGPGALFWMWIAAFFGMATKYAEGFLAIKYRNIDENGHVLGGPFYYIENGMGKKWKWLGKLFAVFGGLCGLIGIGTFSQVNGISTAVKDVYKRQVRCVLRNRQAVSVNLFLCRLQTAISMSLFQKTDLTILSLLKTKASDRNLKVMNSLPATFLSTMKLTRREWICLLYTSRCV